MYIYKITNKINGKIYIGLSKRKAGERWREHKSAASPNQKSRGKRNVIERAFAKYGDDNFTFEIVDTSAETIDELLDLEERYIAEFNSLVPNGYNVAERGEHREWTPELSEINSRKQQGRKKKLNSSSDYIGVYFEDKYPICEIAKSRKKYKRTFRDEIEAAKAYDRMALYLYKNPRLNFEESRGAYSKKELEETFTFFTNKDTLSSYSYVTWVEKKRRWRAIFSPRVEGSFSQKLFKTEYEAACAVDKWNLFRNLGRPLNFPENLDTYTKEDLFEYFKKPDKASRYTGVSFHKKEGKWTSRFIFNGKHYECGYWDSEVKAAEELDKVRLSVTGDISKLIFPEKIDKYKTESIYQARSRPKKKYRGVQASRKRFVACLHKDGEKILSKAFEKEEDAAQAYDIILYLNGGDIRKLNFPEKIDLYKKSDLSDVLKIERDNSLIGIRKKKNRYEVSITVDKKTKYIGMAKTLQEAVELREKSIKYHNKI